MLGKAQGPNQSSYLRRSAASPRSVRARAQREVAFHTAGTVAASQFPARGKGAGGRHSSVKLGFGSKNWAPPAPPTHGDDGPPSVTNEPTHGGPRAARQSRARVPQRNKRTRSTHRAHSAHRAGSDHDCTSHCLMSRPPRRVVREARRGGKREGEEKGPEYASLAWGPTTNKPTEGGRGACVW